MEFQNLANLRRRQALEKLVFPSGPFLLGKVLFSKHCGTLEDFSLLNALSGPELSQCHVEKIGHVFKAPCFQFVILIPCSPKNFLFIPLEVLLGKE